MTDRRSERLEQGQTLSAEPLGALALVGAWGGLADQEIDAMVVDLYAQRERDIVRPVELLEEDPTPRTQP